jgi:Site-specific recombinase XerD
MQLERHDTDDGRRVRLSAGERDRLLVEVADQPRRSIALGFMSLAGLRSKEVLDVTRDDLYTHDSGREFVRVEFGKGDQEREVPVPTQPESSARTYSHTAGRDRVDPILDVSTRTLRNWVDAAAESRGVDESDDRWRYLSPHDLRRTWGQLTLEAGVTPSAVMQMGGWKDYQTFKRHYLGKHSEGFLAEESKKVDWL